MNKQGHHTIRTVENETTENVVQGLIYCNHFTMSCKLKKKLYLIIEASHVDVMRPNIQNEVSVTVLGIVMGRTKLRNIVAPRITRKDAVVDRKTDADVADRKNDGVEVVQRNDVSVNQRIE